MAAVQLRDLVLEELSELWRDMVWWRRVQIILAMRINLFMKRTVELMNAKQIVGWVIVTSLLISIAGFVWAQIENYTLIAGVLGITIGVLVMFALFWLVWRYLR